jgi:hypothetical protein
LGVPLGGTSGLRISGNPPEVFWTSLPSRISSKCRSPGTGQNARHYLEQAVRDQQKGSGTGSRETLRRRCDFSTFQRLGPNVGDGVDPAWLAAGRVISWSFAESQGLPPVR